MTTPIVPTEHAGNILIVDDNRENLRLLAGILSEHTYQVRPVTNGPRALAAAFDDPPDLIMLDIMMPEMDGYAVCQALKADERTANIPIIFISALNEVFDKVKAFQAGGVDYITKPFQMEEVLARVQTHLKLWALQQQLEQQNGQLAQEIADRKRVEQQLQDELAIAREVQQSLLPDAHPDWPGLQVACCCLPAREVGGDLYIYHQFAPDATAPAVQHYALAVGDVSGKGMPAALLMSACMASFRSLVGQTLAPGTFLMHMDSAIGEYTRFTRQNCAMVYLNIVIAPETGRTLRVANAGCIVPMIKRTSGELIWVNVGGIPLGVGLGAKSGYQEAARQLLPGDMVILTSDGVVEARNAEGALFGFERLAQTVCSGPAGSAVALVQHIRSAMQSFVGDALLADDMTIVVIQM